MSLGTLNRFAVALSYSILRTSNNAHATSVANTYITLTSTLRGLIRGNGLGAGPVGKVMTTISIKVIGNRTIYSLRCIRSSTTRASVGMIVARSKHVVRIRKATRNRPFARRRLLALLTLTQKKVRSVMTARGTTLTG